MASVSDLTLWRDRLIEARLNGWRSVQDADGSRIEYRSDSEMRAAIAYVDSLLAAGQPVKTIRLTTSKGLF
jgi:hypothetical protein